MQQTADKTEELVIDGFAVDDEELQIAAAIIDAFNRWNSSDLRLTQRTGRPTKELITLIRCIRESPEVGIKEHRQIIERNFKNPWWKEGRAGSVAAIYGERTWPRCRVNDGYAHSSRTVRRGIDRKGTPKAVGW